jgi:dipeptidyl aminopeptidase/acylaminoacyl peptidase
LLGKLVAIVGYVDMDRLALYGHSMGAFVATGMLAAGVPHELRLYPGADHSALNQDQTVLARVRAWFMSGREGK